MEILFLTAFSACEREVDLRPGGKGTIVVECILSEDNTQTLRLSTTDIASVSLKDADITLTDETARLLVGRFVFKEGNDWALDYTPIPLHRYKLSVIIEGFDVIEAHTQMPERTAVVPKDAYDPQYYPGLPFSHLVDQYPDWELGMAYKISSLPKGAVWVYGMNYDTVSGRHFPAKTIATSLECSDLFNLTGETYWNTYNTQAQTFYDYYYHNDDDYNPLFYSYPEQLRQSMYKYVVGAPLHDTFLRIPPLEECENRSAPDPRNFFSIAGDFQGLNTDRSLILGPEDPYILFVSPSEEYDRYLKELLIEESRQASEKDFSSVFSRENIYSNIENGTGVFGAKTEQKLIWLKLNVYGEWGLHFKW